MGLKGLLDRNEEPSDIESERDALRRQRAEAAAELETLKRTVSERVVAVQQRERELAEALTRVEKREEKLAAAEAKGSRLDSVRLKLAEAKETRGSLDARRAELELREAAVAAREQALAAQGQDEPLPQPAPKARERRPPRSSTSGRHLTERETALAERLRSR